MLRFFRNIRQKLLENGNLRKYFWYAIGEIFLVVIGILIALQINNWNEEKKNQQISLEYHNRMISDLDQMSDFITSELERSERIHNDLISSVRILENRKFNDSTKTILDDALCCYFQLSILSFNISSYDEMKSTGKLNLVYDIELRQQLNNYEKVAYTSEEVIRRLSENLNESKPFIIPHVRFYAGSENPAISYNVQEVAEDPVFINYLSDFASIWYTSIYFQNEMLKRMQHMKAELEAKLKNEW